MPYSPRPRGLQETHLKPKRGSTPSRRLVDTLLDGPHSAARLTEMEWWAVIIAVVAFVAAFTWLQAWFGDWLATAIKEGIDKWNY